MESFPAYLRIARKRGPEPYWTPVAPVHRLFSYPLSYLYCALGLTPLTVTLWGLALALAGLALAAAHPSGGAWFWAGLALLNLGVVHDACDGEVARYRIHHRRQSPTTYRVGMFADFWAFAVVVQALLPALLGFLVWRRGAPAGAWALGLGLAAAFLLQSAYVAGFARQAYWPGRGKGPEEESLSLAAGGPAWLRLARKAYFSAFETAMFTTHATVLLAAWTLAGGTPWWTSAYVLGVASAVALAFLAGIAQTLRRFDRAGAHG
ncbi:MAG TPA: hypothetical protein VHI93_07610 [Candidatus Thermoplasmatota archaeon]|nr:hypothetical protein [Candidatus Thermoplasmatota archaeon]